MNEQQLTGKLEEIKASLDARQWKYYHLTSIDNFVYHLKSFKDEGTRQRMATELALYLESVNEKISKVSNVHQSGKELFPAVWKISETYKYEIGFIRRPAYTIAIILLAGLFLVLKWFINYWLAAAICVLIALVYSLYSYVKMKDRKIW